MLLDQSVTCGNVAFKDQEQHLKCAKCIFLLPTNALNALSSARSRCTKPVCVYRLASLSYYTYDNIGNTMVR